ncbi:MULTISPECIES: hypothetical protein [Pseudomonas]|uniref:hypothetical protein n=1 Tax=Pseudomonas TaxID=286 RepID=UPI000F78DF53|nr:MULTISPECIES: hypothetical protein [Pseudomonas]
MDKLDQVSQRLELSPLAILTLSLEFDKPTVELIDHLRSEIEGLERSGGVPGLEQATRGIAAPSPRKARIFHATHSLQTEIFFPAP